MADKDKEQENQAHEPAPKANETVSKKANSGRIDDNLWNEIMSEWLNTAARNTPVAQTVESWNGLQAALPALKKILEARL